MVSTVTAAQPISGPRSPCRPRVFGAKFSPAPVLPAAPQSAAASCSPNSRSPCCLASNSNRLQPGATGTPGTNGVDLAGGSLARVKSPSGHLSARSLGMSLEERASVCTFDCPDTCSITVTIDDGRVAKVRGSHALPYTAGVICTKVARDMEAFVHGPQRLLYPLRRTGSKGSGQFERISWEAALDEINERLEEVIGRWGPQAILPLNYAGPHGLLAGDSMSLRFFHRLGASQLYRRALCGGVRSEAWPGTDTPLAWAVAAELERAGKLDKEFIDANVLGSDEFMARAREWPVSRAASVCGVPEDQIRTVAEWLAEADPLVVAPGNGLERGRHGGGAIRAIVALPALLGKLGRGNGIVLGASNSFPKTLAKLQRPDLAPAGTRTLNILDIGRHLAEDDLDPPLRAVFIYNHNPIVVHPDQNRMRRGLAREDVFTIGIDVAMTESLAHCDVVLPAATHFEYPDLYSSYGHHWLQRAEPVIAPLGESLPNTEIFRRLAARFGFDEPCFRASDAELMDDAVDSEDARLNGVRQSRIPVDRAVQMKGADGEPLVLFENVFPATPSGKIELKSEALAARWGAQALLPEWRERDGEYPLRLISPASDKRISSTLGGLPGSRPAAPPLLPPEDAAPRQPASGSEGKG